MSAPAKQAQQGLQPKDGHDAAQEAVDPVVGAVGGCTRGGSRKQGRVQRGGENGKEVGPSADGDMLCRTPKRVMASTADTAGATQVQQAVQPKHTRGNDGDIGRKQAKRVMASTADAASQFSGQAHPT